MQISNMSCKFLMQFIKKCRHRKKLESIILLLPGIFHVDNNKLRTKAREICFMSCPSKFRIFLNSLGDPKQASSV